MSRLDATFQGLANLARFKIKQAKEDKLLTHDEKEKSIKFYEKQLSYINGNEPKGNNAAV